MSNNNNNNNNMIIRLENIQPESNCSRLIDLNTTALLIIDMQIDFLMPGGFGSSLGNDVTKLQKCIKPCQRMLQMARDIGMLVIHTREGHRSDMTDVKYHKLQQTNHIIGKDYGPNGRVLIRGEKGHDIIQDLYPIHGEPIIDKPGKGSFYATDLHTILIAQNIQTLLVCGVTTEVCVHTTVREANDRGYYCIVIEDACASFFDTFHTVAIQMITAQNGIFGSVTNSINISTTILQQYNNNNNNNDKNDNDGKDKNDK